MPAIRAEAPGTVKSARGLLFTASLDTSAGPFGCIEDDGATWTVDLPDRDEPEFVSRWIAELSRPAVLVDQIEGCAASKPCLRPSTEGWLIASLSLAVHRKLTASGKLDRESERFTITLLLLLKARRSLRAFLAGNPDCWSSRAAKDLLDALIALEFFDPSRLTPFLQWLVAVLPAQTARELLDGLLPVEEARFGELLLRSEYRELARVVEAAARAQRRLWHLGRYDLAGARRLAPLLERLRRGATLSARFSALGVTVVDALVPRMLGGCLVGILPFLLTEEAWSLATTLPLPLLFCLLAGTLVAVSAYLLYDREVADPARLGSRRGVFQVAGTGLIEALVLAGLVQWLAAPHFNSSLIDADPDLEHQLSSYWNTGVFLASAAFSLGVGVFTQLIWQDKAVTAPP